MTPFSIKKKLNIKNKAKASDNQNLVRALILADKIFDKLA